MTAARFEKINGHTPTVVKAAKLGYTAECICECGDGAVLLTSSGTSEALALNGLLHSVLAEHGRIIMQRARWACADCGKIGPVSAHHNIPRARGRSDKVENLIPLCPNCHERHHANGTELIEVRPAY
jgi:ribosomal protein S27AE